MRLRGVIACLHGENAFLNRLRYTDFIRGEEFQPLNNEEMWKEIL